MTKQWAKHTIERTVVFGYLATCLLAWKYGVRTKLRRDESGLAPDTKQARVLGFPQTVKLRECSQIHATGNFLTPPQVPRTALCIRDIFGVGTWG